MTRLLVLAVNVAARAALALLHSPPVTARLDKRAREVSLLRWPEEDQ